MVPEALKDESKALDDTLMDRMAGAFGLSATGPASFSKLRRNDARDIAAALAIRELRATFNKDKSGTEAFKLAAAKAAKAAAGALFVGDAPPPSSKKKKRRRSKSPKKKKQRKEKKAEVEYISNFEAVKEADGACSLGSKTVIRTLLRGGGEC